MDISNDTLERIKSIKTKAEEVGVKLGIPVEQAVVLVAVDDSRKRGGFSKVWAWFKKALSYANTEAQKIHLD